MGRKNKIRKARQKGLLDKVKKFPDLPGVYIMKDKSGNILYIGKAASLRKRVMSYFHNTVFFTNKASLMRNICDIELIICDSEAKALLLERSLIKEKQPKYNIDLRDDKSFLLVSISKEDFPCVGITRKRKKGYVYYGPYPQGKLLKSALELIRKIFPFRTCAKLPKKECLYFHLSLCPAPCTGRILRKDYASTIRIIRHILNGERTQVMEFLRKRMNEEAGRLHFEKASFLRDKVTAVSSLYGVKKEFQQILSLKQTLGLRKVPFMIEAMDMSNINAKEACGSIVVFRNGVPFKSGYRRFRIKTQAKDDLQMIKEVVHRRIRRILSEKKEFSDLIIVDGGLAQVNAVKEILEKFNLSIPVIGISKKNEEIWFPCRSRPFDIPKDSPALRVIQRLRDEAHRFAHKYHLFLRKKQTYNG